MKHCHSSLCIHLRRQLLVFLGAYRLGSSERDFQPKYPIDCCLDYYFDNLDVQLVSD